MYDTAGHATIVVGYPFLNKALTFQALEEKIINETSFLRVQEIIVDEDRSTVQFECEVFQYLMN
jgi:RNase H-fold protein (predicted Holliday junction resolvase)